MWVWRFIYNSVWRFIYHQMKAHERTQKHTNYVNGIVKLKQSDTWTCSCGYSCAYKYKNKQQQFSMLNVIQARTGEPAVMS